MRNTVSEIKLDIRLFILLPILGIPRYFVSLNLSQLALMAPNLFLMENRNFSTRMCAWPVHLVNLHTGLIHNKFWVTYFPYILAYEFSTYFICQSRILFHLFICKMMMACWVIWLFPNSQMNSKLNSMFAGCEIEMLAWRRYYFLTGDPRRYDISMNRNDE